MYKMKKTGIFTVSLLLLAGALYSVDYPMTARAGHRVVELNKNGTWALTGYEKPGDVNDFVRSELDFIELWYNNSEWTRLDESLSNAAEFSFKHVGEEGYALMIIESVDLSLKGLRDTALKNARKAAPNARITYEETININGTDVLVMDIRGTIDGIKFVYHSAYWSGSVGVFQIITYTSESIFDRVYEDFDSFLAGIVVRTN